MKCKNCIFTLPCYGGLLGGGERAMALCPWCGRISLCVPEENVIRVFYCEQRQLTIPVWKRYCWAVRDRFTPEGYAIFTQSRGPSRTETPVTSILLDTKRAQREWNIAGALTVCKCHMCRDTAPPYNWRLHNMTTKKEVTAAIKARMRMQYALL